MKCPFCENQDTVVIDSRDAEEKKVIRRRRECEKCKTRFTTYERPQLSDILVEKRGGKQEPYQREKIESGIEKAMEKRPIAEGGIEEILDTVESKIFTKNKSVIKSKEIGALVVEELSKIDSVAYLRFLSVYRSFGSLESFDKEIKKIKKNYGQKSRNKS